MKNIKFIYIFIILFLACNSSLVAQEWVEIYKNYSEPYKDAEGKPSAIALDSYGNIYIAGIISSTQNNSDICIIKYNTNGDTLWTKLYYGNGVSEDKAYAITVDDLDNVYIGGYTTTAAGRDILILKYSADGILLWTKTYNGSANADDIAYAMKLDNAGNLYVCGFSTQTGSGADYITLKYTGNNGTLVWAKTFNGTGNSTDMITAAAIGPDNKIVVTGNSMGTSQTGSEDIVTIKYDENGSQLWNKKYDGSDIGNTTDKVYAITIDNSNKVYLTGNLYDGNISRILIIGYNSDGEIKWEVVYISPNPNHQEFPCNIISTDNNYILVSGTTINGPGAGDEDFVTIALHSNNGKLKWWNTYNSPFDGTDVVSSMSLSETKNELYVSGYSSRNPQNSVLDIVTLKYKLSNGTLMDSTRFNNTGISKESPVGITVDLEGKVYITGWTIENNGKRHASLREKSDIITIKYSMGNYSSPNSYTDNKNAANKNMLYQNYPNPFNPITVIKFELLSLSRVELKIYDMLGKEVQTLVSGYLEAGEHNFRFNGGNLSSGIYIYELNVNGVKDIKKMLLLK